MAKRTRPGQLRRMRGREFLKSDGVEEIWPEGVWNVNPVEAPTATTGEK